AEVGQPQQALEPAQRSVDIWERLAEVNPDAYLPDLALSLNNFANRLAEVGQPQQALEPAQLSVDIREGLAEVNPDAYLPNLALSLNNFAQRSVALRWDSRNRRWNQRSDPSTSGNAWRRSTPMPTCPTSPCP
ncbi:tetratricopeptide repeat protein, partial [Saccharothrix algeriensis]